MSGCCDNMSATQYTSEVKLQVILIPAMSLIRSLKAGMVSSQPIFMALSAMLSGVFSRDRTCSMGL